MKPILRILQTVLVNHFYAGNAGFFFFLFFVLFGLPYQPVVFHRSLIEGIIQNQGFLGLIMILWVLYNLKCADYTLKQLAHPRQLFLFTLNSLRTKHIHLYMAYVQVTTYLPAVVYSIFMATIAAQKGYYLVIFEIILFHAAVIFVTTRVYVQRLQRSDVPATATKPLLAVRLRFAKPFWLWPLYYTWYQKKQMIFVTKCFTLALLHAFIVLYEPEKKDIRPLLLCMLLISGANSAIVFQIRLFEDEFLPFTKNLPIKAFRRFGYLCTTYVLLSLPELVFLWKGYGLHFNLAGYPQLSILFVALLLLFHTTLLMANTTMDQFIRIVFGIMAALFFIIMYNPGIALPVSLLVLARLFFEAYFYTFEKEEKAA